MLPASFAFALATVIVTTFGPPESAHPIVGECEHVYALAPENTAIRGVAWDESSGHAPRLFALDQSGRVFEYVLSPDDSLQPTRTFDLRTAPDADPFASPRGLACAVEADQSVLYFLDAAASGTRLWRYVIENGTATSVDLSLSSFRIGDREGLDVACDGGDLLVSYDASGHTDQNRRVQRGIIRINWHGAMSEQPACAEHLPDAGTAPARGLTTMQLDGNGYLWATVGDEYIYCAELRTGRGLLFFDRPRSVPGGTTCWGICFGQGALWVTEDVPGSDRVHRVNVTRNLDQPYTGPRVPRRLIMTIDTAPEVSEDDPGAVYHYYSRPYDSQVMPNQGIWLETEQIQDLSHTSYATIQQVALDPAGDSTSRQILHCVTYDAPTAASHSSRYEIDLWTNPYKKYVYPHRVDRDEQALTGTCYLADDSTLYNLSDRATYESFVQRVGAHIRRKYAVEPDMENAYWAARNVVEYIQDNYYYPSLADRKPATVDYERAHFDANPANLKIELSARPYDKTQIIACSGTSVMVAGALRHLGIPARWLGTGTQQAAGTWDGNGNGLLDPDETAICTNGHRYTQVWLGSHYGWICFDATPSKPADNDYDLPPPLQPQWRYMTRCASGHREPRRMVFNIGSELVLPLYREFEFDERLAIDNNCGGDQRYNLQGRFEKCALWRSPSHAIQVRNLCFVEQVKVLRADSGAVVTWQLAGAWERIPETTVSLYLQHREGTALWHDAAVLTTAIPANTSSASVDLAGHHGPQYRIIIRRDGDPETGGVSSPFALD